MSTVKKSAPVNTVGSTNLNGGKRGVAKTGGKKMTPGQMSQQMMKRGGRKS